MCHRWALARLTLLSTATSHHQLQPRNLEQHSCPTRTQPAATSQHDSWALRQQLPSCIAMFSADILSLYDVNIHASRNLLSCSCMIMILSWVLEHSRRCWCDSSVGGAGQCCWDIWQLLLALNTSQESVLLSNIDEHWEISLEIMFFISSCSWLSSMTWVTHCWWSWSDWDRSWCC